MRCKLRSKIIDTVWVEVEIELISEYISENFLDIFSSITKEDLEKSVKVGNSFGQEITSKLFLGVTRAGIRSAWLKHRFGNYRFEIIHISADFSSIEDPTKLIPFAGLEAAAIIATCKIFDLDYSWVKSLETWDIEKLEE